METITAYTTAPAAYDGFGTQDQGIVGFDGTRPIRKVEIEPQHSQWQSSRYHSGMHPCWSPEEYTQVTTFPWYKPVTQEGT